MPSHIMKNGSHKSEVNTRVGHTLWKGDREVVERSGSDEPIWIATHICMEAMLGPLCMTIFILN
jgi:hypothetical protein